MGKPMTYHMAYLGEAADEIRRHDPDLWKIQLLHLQRHAAEHRAALASSKGKWHEVPRFVAKVGLILAGVAFTGYSIYYWRRSIPSFTTTMAYVAWMKGKEQQVPEVVLKDKGGGGSNAACEPPPCWNPCDTKCTIIRRPYIPPDPCGPTPISQAFKLFGFTVAALAFIYSIYANMSGDDEDQNGEVPTVEGGEEEEAAGEAAAE